MHKTIMMNVILSFCLFGLTSMSYGDRPIRIDLNAGIANITDNGYEDGIAYGPSISYESYKHKLIYRVGILAVDQLYLTDTNLGDEEVEIEISGTYLGVGKAIDINALKLELNGGAMLVKTEGNYRGRKFEDDREARPYLNAKLVIPLSGLFAFQGDIKYVSDVSGSDLITIGGGVRFSF